MDAARRKRYARHSVKPEKCERSGSYTVRLTFQLHSLKPQGLRGAAASSLIKNLLFAWKHSHYNPHLLGVFISSLSVAVQAQTHHIESPPFLPPPALWGLWLIVFDGVCAWKKKKQQPCACTNHYVSERLEIQGQVIWQSPIKAAEDTQTKCHHVGSSYSSVSFEWSCLDHFMPCMLGDFEGIGWLKNLAWCDVAWNLTLHTHFVVVDSLDCIACHMTSNHTFSRLVDALSYFKKVSAAILELSGNLVWRYCIHL